MLAESSGSICRWYYSQANMESSGIQLRPCYTVLQLHPYYALELVFTKFMKTPQQTGTSDRGIVPLSLDQLRVKDRPVYLPLPEA